MWCASKIKSAVISSIDLTSIPFSTLEVSIVVLDDDGGCLAAAILAASVAIFTSKVVIMKDIVTAVSLMTSARDGHMFVDPTLNEMECDDASCCMTVAVLSKTGDITQMLMEDRKCAQMTMTPSLLKVAQDYCASIANHAHSVISKTKKMK